MSSFRLNRDTTLNILIIISLIFFIGMTFVLIGLFIANDVLHYKNFTDQVLTMAVFAGWSAFIIIILMKAFSIYKQIPNAENGELKK